MTPIQHRPRRLLPILSLLLLAPLSFSCAGSTQNIPPTVENTATAPTMTPTEEVEELPTLDELGESDVSDVYQEIDLCDLNADRVGDPLRVTGQITYLDDSAPEGMYFDLQKEHCQVGVWLDQSLFETLAADDQALLALENKVAVKGILYMEGGEYMLDPDTVEEFVFQRTQLDPSEEWWAHPQSYHYGEGPYEYDIQEMDITALHDWATLGEAFAPEPQVWASEEEIIERWDNAHKEGMRVEAVLSVIDMWYIVYEPGDEVYNHSGINLMGEHIEYKDPVGFVGCTNKHGWQEFTRQRIFKAIDWGADGIIIDDYEGTSRWTSGVGSGIAGSEHGPGGCFCEACEAGFRAYLQETYTEDQLVSFGIIDIDNFDYSDYLRERGWTMEMLGAESVKFSGWDSRAQINIPLYQDYADFQNREVVKFLETLKQDALAYARDNYGREISWSVNASEVTYGTHKFYDMFDRNMGGINYFGYPPLGTEGYLYRLGYAIHGNPRLRDIPRNDVVVAVMNEYQTHNLWTIKGAEAYANQGALVEPSFFAVEGVSDEEAETLLQNDPETRSAYNTFYLQHADLFDFPSTATMAKTAVLYSSPSVHYDMYRHTQSFNGISEILTDLHVQFDPLFIGDGISYPDNLDAETLDRYDLVFLPNVSALTRDQAAELLAYVQSGGSLVSLGRFGLLDENGDPLESEDIQALKERSPGDGEEGGFFDLYEPFLQMEGIAEGNLHDKAAYYYQYYIENNHPAVEAFLYLIEEQPTPHISDAAADRIRAEFSDLVDRTLSSRVVLDTLSESIGIQVYRHEDPEPKIILHLLNYNYELETDTVIEQEEIQVALEAPVGWDVSRVSVISPDFDGEQELDFVIEEGYLRFTVPGLTIWDVVVIE